MLRRVYDWILGFAEGPNALWALIAVAFAESSFFPIPPDVLLIPMALARRERAMLYALVATLASVVGGFLGYAIGYFLYETIGRAIVHFYGLEAAMASFQAVFDQRGWEIIVLKGMTPIPYKLITIASGIAHYDLGLFAAASVICRAMRFFLVAGLIQWFGAPVKAFIERYLVWVTTAVVLLVVGGFVILKFL